MKYCNIYHPTLQAITQSFLLLRTSPSSLFVTRSGRTVLTTTTTTTTFACRHHHHHFNSNSIHRTAEAVFWNTNGPRPQHVTHSNSIRMLSTSNSSSAEVLSSSSRKNLVVDPFCYRQFAEKESSKSYAGVVFDISIDKFEEIVNSRYNDDDDGNPAQKLQDGYAPFCKHLFLVNDFSNARVNVLSITPENEQYLRTRYEARNEDELPVLTRYFDRKLLLSSSPSSGSSSNGGSDDEKMVLGDESDIFPVAKYIDLILYSREQINKENAAMGKSSEMEDSVDVVETAPWGIVSIKAQDVNYELPMTPITIMRNALGKDHGGSGVEIVREAYMESVEYWKDRANVL